MKEKADLAYIENAIKLIEEREKRTEKAFNIAKSVLRRKRFKWLTKVKQKVTQKFFNNK